jgi:hypothetical protein
MLNRLSDFSLYLQEEGWEPVKEAEQYGWYQREDGELKHADELLREAVFGRKNTYE